MSDIDLINAFLFYNISKRSDSDSTVYKSIENNLYEQIINLEGEVLILDSQEETYNEMYMNAKENPTNFGLFSKIGLATTQDFVLAYFYFSYVMFFCFLIITAVKQAEQKTMVGLSIFSIAFVVGVLMTSVLTAYA